MKVVNEYYMEAIIEYLKNNDGYNYELYNRLCLGMGEPDSNIVEYGGMFYINGGYISSHQS